MPIAGLLALLDVEPWLGRSIDDQPRGQVSTTATVRRGIARLEDPGASPPGVVVVALHGDVQDDDVVLLEVNGAVVTAAPLRTTGGDNGVADLLLPPGALAPSGNEIELALLRDGRVLRLGG